MYVLLLAEGFEEVEAITPADFLRRAGVEVRLVGIAEKTVTGGHGIRVTADTTLPELEAELQAHPGRKDGPDPDIQGVILPGGMPGAANLAASEAVLALIRRLFAAGRMVAAICAAPAVVLAAAGVVEGRRVTCFPGFEERFEGSGARFVEERVVVDGNLITSRGAGTAAEFAFALIECVAGRDKAEEIHRRTLQPGAPPARG
jgi:4-methyl-5(b-hydroxyethyl)-thiazole monophosphate biosynthesis